MYSNVQQRSGEFHSNKGAGKNQFDIQITVNDRLNALFLLNAHFD